MVASWVSSLTVFSPSPQGTTILTVLKLTVTFISSSTPLPEQKISQSEYLSTKCNLKCIGKMNSKSEIAVPVFGRGVNHSSAECLHIPSGIDCVWRTVCSCFILYRHLGGFRCKIFYFLFLSDDELQLFKEN